jgi:sec-independent protein translocase protein TatA
MTRVAQMKLLPRAEPSGGRGVTIGSMPSGNELLIILIAVLVLFGGSQLPKIARNIGSAQKEFKKGLAEASAEDETEKDSSETTTDKK